MAKKLAFAALLLIPAAMVARLLWGVKPNILVEAKTVPAEELLAAIPDEIRFVPRDNPEATSAWQGLLLTAQRTRRLSMEATEALDSALYRPARLAELKTMATLEDLFDRHSANMKLAAEIVARKEAEVGIVRGEENPVNALRGLQALVTLFGRRGTVRVAQGELQSGVDDLISAHRLGTRILGAGGPTYYSSLGSSLLSRAAKEMRIACGSPRMTDGALSKLAASLPTDEELNASFLRSLQSEFHWFAINEIGRLRGPGGNSSPHGQDRDRRRDIDSGWRDVDTIAAEVLRGHAKPFDRLQTVRDAVPIYRELIANLNRPWRHQFMVEDQIRRLVSEWPKASLSGRPLGSPTVQSSIAELRGQTMKSENPYGRLAIWYFIPVSDQSRAAPFRCRAEIAACRITIALQRYWRDRATFPNSLEELAQTGYLKSVPLDPFSGLPFRYDRSSSTVWSVGPNGVDDGGTQDPGNTNLARDLVWKVEPGTEVRPAEAGLVAAEVERRRLERESPIGEIRRMTRGPR